MEHLRHAAQQSVLRACGFGSLAIFCVMVGLSFDPHASFKAGGILTTIMVIVLIMKAYEALTKDYRKTEMWLCLPKDFRPPESFAQRVSAAVLHQTYLTFAKWTSAIAIVLWLLALLFAFIGS